MCAGMCTEMCTNLCAGTGIHTRTDICTDMQTWDTDMWTGPQHRRAAAICRFGRRFHRIFDRRFHRMFDRRFHRMFDRRFHRMFDRRFHRMFDRRFHGMFHRMPVQPRHCERACAPKRRRSGLNTAAVHRWLLDESVHAASVDAIKL